MGKKSKEKISDDPTILRLQRTFKKITKLEREKQRDILPQAVELVFQKISDRVSDRFDIDKRYMPDFLKLTPQEIANYISQMYFRELKGY